MSLKLNLTNRELAVWHLSYENPHYICYSGLDYGTGGGGVCIVCLTQCCIIEEALEFDLD
jgi:hypothetical protein